MLTNNFLFKPKKISGIKKNEDHLFQMLETLGPMEKEYAINGKYSGELFNKKGKLLNGNPKTIVPISRLLVQKYDYDPQAAVAVEEFLLPMLTYEPKVRIDARTCLKSKWLWE
jgi:serine/threonine-protein kinase SRPK3